MKNLEMYIAKGQKIITSVKVSNSDVLSLIKGIDMSEGYPKGMKLSAKEKLYYAQYSKDYFVGGNGDNVIKADKYRINLYFSPMKRAEAMCDIQEAIDGQSAAVAALVADKKPVTNQDDAKRQYNMLKLTFNENNTIASFEENKEKKASMLLTAGFFAGKTLGVDFDPLQAKNNYGMRDEQEKCFALQKGPLGQDRLRTWSGESKHGRMKFVTPFVGAQVKICEAFGFPIPDCCAPVYVSKAKQTTRRRGRPVKPKVEKQTF